MYQDIFKDVRQNLQPMLDVAAINRKTLARMASVQTQCLSEFISTGMNQAKDLSTAGDVKTIADLQFKYLREFEHKLAASAEENISVMSDAKDEISEVLSNSYGRLAENIQFGEKMVKSAAESATMPVPIRDKAPVRRAAKSDEDKSAGPKVETKQESKSEGPKVEAKSEPSETKARTSEAEAKRDAGKDESVKIEVKAESAKGEDTKSGTDTKQEAKSGSSKSDTDTKSASIKAESGKGEDTKSASSKSGSDTKQEAKSGSSKTDTDTKSKSSSSTKR